MTASSRSLPGLTTCASCVGETLGAADPRPGGQLARLQALERAGCARLATVECLDVCESDVVVVRPSPRGRRAGGRPVWFSRLAGEEPTAALARWLDDGGPGLAPVPEPLRPLVVAAPGVTAAG